MSAIICLSNELKAIIEVELSSGNVQPKIAEAIMTELENISECEGGLPMDFGDAGVVGRGGKRRKGDRKPSEYQLFIGECMKGAGIKSFAEAPPAMKACVVKWKEKKGQPS